MGATKDDRIGEVSMANDGSYMEIIEYINRNNVSIIINDRYIIKNKRYDKFKNGNISNPYNRSVFGIGYLGEGKYRNSINRVETKQYTAWKGMLGRCYCERQQQKQPSYVDCTVCEEWHNFQSFAKWFDENYYEVDDDKIELDKDILVKNNKIYSPENCIFVPKRINSLFVKRTNDRGTYPIGVCFNKASNKFQCYCNTDGRRYCGTFDTPEDAFYVYKITKEKYIKQVADEYKDKIPKKLYDALYVYEVEITD